MHHKSFSIQHAPILLQHISRFRSLLHDQPLRGVPPPAAGALVVRTSSNMYMPCCTSRFAQYPYRKTLSRGLRQDTCRLALLKECRRKSNPAYNRKHVDKPVNDTFPEEIKMPPVACLTRVPPMALLSTPILGSHMNICVPYNT